MLKTIIKNTINKYLIYFNYYYFYLRLKIIYLLIISSIVGLLDGFGIAMFLPLLQMTVNNTDTVISDSNGGINIIITTINYLGVELNLISTLILMFVFFTMKGVFSFAEGYLTVVYRQFFINKIREKCINMLSEYNFEKFVQSDAGRIQNVLSGEVHILMLSYISYMFVLRSIVTIIVYMSLSVITNPEFSVLVIIGAILSNLLYSKIYLITKTLSKKLVNINNNFQGLLIQQVAFFKYLKATGAIKDYSKKLIEKIREIDTVQMRMGIYNSLLLSLREPLLILITVIVIILEITILNGSIGLIILSLIFMYRALQSVLQMQTQWNAFLSYSGSIFHLQEFMNELKENKEANGKDNINNFHNSILLSNVFYGFNEKNILKNINLKIRKGETVAIVGDSGAGKTMLVNIICGLLKPKKGQVYFDGKPYSEINLSSLTNRIGYITQEPVIFDDTIYNNVTFWAENNTTNMKRFNEAVSKSHIHKFIEKLSDKEKSRLGNNGINISGGQKQRITIARELYKDIDILIMDEATSALDSKTEENIRENIDLLKRKYTIIIIAHRLSTIKNADRIIILKNGEIYDEGTYNNLVKSNDDFHKMVIKQGLSKY